MRTRRRKIIAATAVAALLLVVALCVLPTASAPPDPIYNGKHLSEWLRQPPVSNGPGSFFIDVGGVTHIDTNAIPLLVATLRNTSTLGTYYLRLWSTLPKWLQQRSPYPHTITKRRNAAVLLMELGDKARPAVPTLAQVLRSEQDPLINMSVANLLGGLGKSDPIAKQALIDAAKADPYRRGYALIYLEHLDPVAAAQLLTNNPAALTNAASKK